ncbi:hypothetical protein MMC08_005601 [Hypocenomyce scalaris]|nr:hypothetical protein [Hypocenomyce scalaris]
MKSVLSLAVAFLVASASATPLAPRAQNTTNSTTNSTTPTYPLLSGPCLPGSFACNSNSTFSQCVATSDTTTNYVFMGSVAAGMICQDGEVVRNTLGPCSPEGALFCMNHGMTFSLCAPGGLIYMGSVAAGTVCQNGTIGFAPEY